jgi:hypothetical protein
MGVTTDACGGSPRPWRWVWCAWRWRWSCSSAGGVHRHPRLRRLAQRVDRIPRPRARRPCRSRERLALPARRRPRLHPPPQARPPLVSPVPRPGGPRVRRLPGRLPPRPVPHRRPLRSRPSSPSNGWLRVTVHRGVGDGGPSVPRPARRIQKLRSGAGGRPLDHVRQRACGESDGHVLERGGEPSPCRTLGPTAAPEVSIWSRARADSGCCTRSTSTAAEGPVSRLIPMPGGGYSGSWVDERT